MSHIGLSVYLKLPLLMDAGASFLAGLSVYLKLPLFMDAGASFLMNVKLQPDVCCQ